MNNIPTAEALIALRRLTVELLDVDAAVRAGSARHLLPVIETAVARVRERFGYDAWIGAGMVEDAGPPDQIVLHYMPVQRELTAEDAASFRETWEAAEPEGRVWLWPVFGKTPKEAMR
jgi:hypothetical protein